MPKLRRPTRDHQDVKRLGRDFWVACVLSAALLAACGQGRPLEAFLPTPGATAPPSVSTATIAPSRAPADWAPPPTPTPWGGRDPIAYLLAHPMPPRDEVRIAREFLGREVPQAEPLCRGREAGLGAQDTFWVEHVEGTLPTWRVITATLVWATPHMRIWLEEGLEADPEALARSAQILEERIYSAVKRLLGLEGQDPLAHCPMTILNAHVRGASGYYLSLNNLPKAANPYSNERPMIVINLSALASGTVAYEATLAHELQHALLDSLDPNEQAWVTEGLSKLAEEWSGYTEGSSARAYLIQPSISPLNWAVDPASVEAHYGAAYLLMRYLSQRYGEGILGAFAHEPADGLAGFEATLRRLEPKARFDTFFGDWLAANVLNIPSLEGGRYGYPGLGLAPMACPRVEGYPFTAEGALPPYGALCWEFSLPDGGLALSFEGQPLARLVPTEATSGQWMWWSNQGDQGHSTLERMVDLRGVRGAVLSYKAWFEIEEGWDYAYLRASADDGNTWEFLRTPTMREAAFDSYALGPGYTGTSGGWVAEEVSLDRFAGRVIRLRFDYITDDAVHSAGLCLDDFRLEATGWEDTVEKDENGWHAEGFLRIENRLPQRYLLQAIALEGGKPHIERLHVEGTAHAEWRLPGAAPRQTSVYVTLAAITPFAGEPSRYRLTVRE